MALTGYFFMEKKVFDFLNKDQFVRWETITRNAHKYDAKTHQGSFKT